MEDELSIKVSTDEIKCKKCVWGLLDAYSIGCAKYKFKPSDVLYENADCKKFEDNGEDENED